MKAREVIEEIDLHAGMLKLKRAKVHAFIEGTSVRVEKVFVIFNIMIGTEVSSPIVNIIPDLTLDALNEIRTTIFNRHNLHLIQDHIDDWGGPSAS